MSKHLIVFCEFVFKVKTALQQTGFLRSKRGFKPLPNIPVSEIKLQDPDITSILNQHKDSKLPTDPLFPKEWFLVSI